jgi:hypothetical protein
VRGRQSIIPLSSSKAEGKRSKGRPAATPWLRMMRHPALWAIVVNNFTFHYAFYVVMNWLPTYFDKVLPPHAPCGTRGSGVMVKGLRLAVQRVQGRRPPTM